MTFENWWATLTTREQARMVRDDVVEAWNAATIAEREACANRAKAAIDPELETADGESLQQHVEDEIMARSNAKVSGAGTASAGLPG
jgi:hypothetical protein